MTSQTASTPPHWSRSRCPATPSDGWPGYIHAAPCIAITPSPAIRNQLALSWGTQPHLVTHVDSSEEMLRIVDQTVLAIGGFAPGDGVVIVAGAPPHTIGLTDLLRVHRLGANHRT